MSSTIVTSDHELYTDMFGNSVNTPIYMQFVPGKVVEVCTNKNNLRAKGLNKNINSIIAKPHIYSSLPPRNSRLGDKYRYFPLLRGITEVPAKGDPVLLCTIGNKNYYMGPLNTSNQVNWNDDNMWKPELSIDPTNTESTIHNTSENIKGESKNFDKYAFNRMAKYPSLALDHPITSTPLEMLMGRASNETHGDMMLEGRHGNSIRIGSRHINPYIYISNGRDTKQQNENLGDGSLISITSRGNLGQHFGGFYHTLHPDSKPSAGYQFSSDVVPRNRTIFKSVQSVNQYDSTQADAFIKNYFSNQILIRSDRLILDSKIDDIYLTSYNDIHIGAGKHMTITLDKNLVIEAEKIFLGDPNLHTSTDTELPSEQKMQPMVLGTMLVEFMSELLTIVKNSKGVCQSVPIGLVDETGLPDSVSNKIATLEKKLKGILSSHHSIEPNNKNGKEWKNSQQ